MNPYVNRMLATVWAILWWAMSLSVQSVETAYEADSRMMVESFNPGFNLSSGAGVAAKVWMQKVKTEPIEDVAVRVRKVSGGRDCHVLLRMGRKGPPLEQGKRVYLRDARPVDTGWYLGGKAVSDALVVEVVNGQAVLETVKVYHKP